MILHSIIKKVRDLRVNGFKSRSPEWAKVRKDWIEKNPACAICGSTKKVEVHHKMPFHLHPELELVPGNLITLCESKDLGVNCHLQFGHGDNFKWQNDGLVKDIAAAKKVIAKFVNKSKVETEVNLTITANKIRERVQSANESGEIKK